MGDLFDSETLAGTRKSLRRAWKAARHVLKKRLRVLGLVHQAYDKLAENEDALGRIRRDLVGMLRLISAWASREYQRVPWRSVLYAVAAVIYLLNPADAIPDALLGIGFVDDIAVITAVAKAIQKDLEQFRAWEQQQDDAVEETTDVEPAAPTR